MTARVPTRAKQHLAQVTMTDYDLYEYGIQWHCVYFANRIDRNHHRHSIIPRSQLSESLLGIWLESSSEARGASGATLFPRSCDILPRPKTETHNYEKR